MTKTKLFISLLLNLFVLPGSGQIYLKEKKRGYLISLLVIALLVIFSIHIISIVQAAITPALAKPNDITSIMTLAQSLSEGIWQENEFTLKGYTFLIGCVYIFSFMDLIWIYLKKQE